MTSIYFLPFSWLLTRSSSCLSLALSGILSFTCCSICTICCFNLSSCSSRALKEKKDKNDIGVWHRYVTACTCNKTEIYKLKMMDLLIQLKSFGIWFWETDSNTSIRIWCYSPLSLMCIQVPVLSLMDRYIFLLMVCWCWCLKALELHVKSYYIVPLYTFPLVEGTMELKDFLVPPYMFPSIEVPQVVPMCIKGIRRQVLINTPDWSWIHTRSILNRHNGHLGWQSIDTPLTSWWRVG